MEIDQFNKTIDIWISELSRFSILQLHIKPDAQGWSLGQVYQHVIDESTWYNGQIELALQGDTNHDKETSHVAEILFKRGSFENKRFQGDPFISENVSQPESVEKLKADLLKLKKDINDTWHRIKSVSASGKSEHPGLGFLSCREWIQYAEMHMRHHLRQKERIEATLKNLH